MRDSGQKAKELTSWGANDYYSINKETLQFLIWEHLEPSLKTTNSMKLRFEHEWWSMKLLCINFYSIVKMYKLTAMTFATINLGQIH